jgi:type VI protein secretion system component Hcp
MVDQVSTDIIMQILLDGKPIAGSSTLALSRSRMLEDFKPGCFFEIEAIDFGLTRPASTPSTGGAQQGAATDLGEIQVTRRIDGSSLKLMECCFCSKPVTSATIVKRRSSGTNFAAEPYLRVDFNGVLITRVSWSDADIVNETYTFICREMSFKYMAQDASGNLSGNYNAVWRQVISGNNQANSGG